MSGPRKPDKNQGPTQIPPAGLIADCARFVEAARVTARMNQKEFARRAGVSRALVNRLINASGTEPPRLQTLEKIARASGKHVRLVLGD